MFHDWSQAVGRHAPGHELAIFLLPESGRPRVLVSQRRSAGSSGVLRLTIFSSVQRLPGSSTNTLTSICVQSVCDIHGHSIFALKICGEFQPSTLAGSTREERYQSEARPSTRSAVGARCSARPRGCSSSSAAGQPAAVCRMQCRRARRRPRAAGTGVPRVAGRRHESACNR